jgi:heme exporter protein C
MVKKHWWKVLSVLILIYSISGAWLGDVSVQVILHETIRNLYFHVTQWFAMIFLFGISFVNAIRFLRKESLQLDILSVVAAEVAMVFGSIGIVTGMIWAKFTWGAMWVNDPKLNGSAVSLLIYIAYFVLRSSITDEMKRARLSAVYNIFSFIILIVLIGILPRMTDSLHPGNGGNPAFGNYDLKDTMKLVFYPAVIGWIMFGVWIYNVVSRFRFIKHQKENQ